MAKLKTLGKRIFKATSISFVVLFVSVIAVIFFSPRPDLLKTLDFSTAVYDNQQGLLRLSLNNAEAYRLYTPLNQIAPSLIEATLLQEDQYFYHHVGINPIALLRAGVQTYFGHSRRFGASTITMQLARLRFGIHSKTILGKVQQIYQALTLERHYSKQEILEAYLNLAPYGGNIEGVGAASYIYFKKSALNLSLAEALHLSVIPQNPRKRRLDANEDRTLTAAVFQRWLSKHPEDKQQLSLPLQAQKASELPFLAPHFVNKVLAMNPPEAKSIASTLDPAMQKLVERIGKQYIRRHQHLGVKNAAVLLVDTRDMGVKAMLGSVDFFDADISGQINGTSIPRSPGSTLKPFIYARALDQGLIHPDSLLKDVPHSFAGYNPENFDYEFMGPITATEALTQSRNIPALSLANLLQPQHNLYRLLKQIKVRGLKTEGFYGLSLALGGLEMSMQELVSLYAMLQNDGVWVPLRFKAPLADARGSDSLRKVPRAIRAARVSKRYLSPGNFPKKTRLLSPEASFLVLEMLKQTPHPEFGPLTKQHQIAFKTGTSSGYRDAWTIGLFGPYVLGIWVGNFDNEANPAFVGKNIAAPLFFTLVEGIGQTRPIQNIDKDVLSMNLQRVDVCKPSGMLPTRFCPETKKTWFIPGKSPITSDTIYREIAINSKTGLRSCHVDKHTHFEVYEFWPSDLLAIFKQAGIQRQSPPPFEPGCNFSETTGMRPEISSPLAQTAYVLPSNHQSRQIPLSAIADADVHTLYWFVNETFVGTSSPYQTLFWRGFPGEFVIRVVDDHGQSDVRELKVRGDS